MLGILKSGSHCSRKVQCSIQHRRESRALGRLHTLVYPPGTIHTVCHVTLARVAAIDSSSFIVVFCNAIQKADAADLETLQQFVASLESCRTVSEGADKLYKMCHLFLQVAKLCIQAKKNDTGNPPQTVTQPAPNNFYTTTDSTQLDLSTMTQFDPYLSALGLVPNSAWPMTGYTDTSAVGTAMESFANVPNTANTQGSEGFGLGYASNGIPQNSVQDWFSGSRYLMNLMEADDNMQMPNLNDYDVQL